MKEGESYLDCQGDDNGVFGMKFGFEIMRERV